MSEVSEAKKPLHIGKPKWLKTKIPTGKVYFDIKKDLRKRKLATVCEEAKCPNIGECWNTKTATFMVLGDTCTRACRFCHIKTGNPNGWIDPQEPTQVAESSKLMGLDYVVITMVDRDDMDDGGARHVANVIEKVKELNPGIRVELLAGDFKGDLKSVDQILETKLEVYAHNIETIERLSPRVRDARADYRQSLQVLKHAKEWSHEKDRLVLTKSAIMLGLGETQQEVIQALNDLREVDCDIVTIGQYMRPTKKHLAVKDWVKPEVFEALEKKALELGFLAVAAKPLVRSSYKANTVYDLAIEKFEAK